MTSFIDYLNNDVIKLPIYYTLHSCTAKQSMDIIPKLVISSIYHVYILYQTGFCNIKLHINFYIVFSTKKNQVEILFLEIESKS